MLKGEHRRRRKERDLLAVHHGLERRAHGDLGLAVPDVAAQQPVHRRGRFHVALDVGDRRLLVGRQVVLEGVLELLLPVRVRAERVAGHGLARGVELEQLLGHVAHGLLDPALDALPRRPAQPIDRRPGCAGVLLHQVEPLDGHEQLVFAGVAQLEKFLFVVADADLLQADEDADPVLHVHDEIADLEIAQVGEERLGDGSPLVGRAAVFVENIGFGEELEAGLREAKSSRQVAQGHEHRGVARIVGAVGLNGQDVVVLEQLDRALGPAGRGRDEQHRFAGLAQLPDFGDEVGDAAVQLDGGLAGDVMRAGVESELGDHGALGQLRGDLLPVGKERLGGGRLLAPVQRFVVPVPELFQELRDVGVHLVAFGHDDADGAGLQVVEQRRAAVVAQDVTQRHDGQLIDRRDRSLRAGIVCPKRLDRVADELEAHRMGGAGGENVQDAAAAGELAVLVGRVLAVEAGIDEELGQILRGDVLPRLQVHRGAQHVPRRAHARQQRRGRRDDHTRGAARERVQGRCPHRRDADVRRHASIGIDLVRRHGQDGALHRRLRQTLERREKEPDVGDRAVQVRVARQHVEHDAVGQAGRGRRHEKRLGRRAQPGYGARRCIETAARNRGLEDGPEVERRGCRHGVGFLIFSMIAVVEYPASNGIRITCPPRASTMSRPIMLDSDQSAPLTSTSGSIRLMSS